MLYKMWLPESQVGNMAEFINMLWSSKQNN
jgi:hypothetical protein